MLRLSCFFESNQKFSSSASVSFLLPRLEKNCQSPCLDDICVFVWGEAKGRRKQRRSALYAPRKNNALSSPSLASASSSFSSIHRVWVCIPNQPLFCVCACVREGSTNSCERRRREKEEPTSSGPGIEFWMWERGNHEHSEQGRTLRRWIHFVNLRAGMTYQKKKGIHFFSCKSKISESKSWEVGGKTWREWERETETEQSAMTSPLLLPSFFLLYMDADSVWSDEREKKRGFLFPVCKRRDFYPPSFLRLPSPSEASLWNIFRIFFRPPGIPRPPLPSPQTLLLPHLGNCLTWISFLISLRV